MKSVNVLSPGPLPRGPEAPGTIDLGVRLRDCLTGERLSTDLRRGLAQRLQVAVQSQDWPGAAALLRAYVNSWPLAALVDAAQEGWCQSGDSRSLAALAQAAELLRLSRGWERGPDGVWPVPGADWVREQVGDAQGAIRRRHPLDGAQWVGGALGWPLTEPPPDPRVLLTDTWSLVTRRAELVRSIVQGPARAVCIQDSVPPDAEAQLALGELRMEASAQQAFEALGAPGLAFDHAPDWTEALRPPPEQELATTITPLCDWALLPGTPGSLARGEVKAVGWLMWEGPHPAVPVQPQVVVVLRELKGLTQGAAPPELIRELVPELLRMGAVGPMPDEVKGA